MEGLVFVVAVAVIAFGFLRTEESESGIADVPAVIDSLLKEEPTAVVKPVEEREAKEIVRNVFGSHHEYQKVVAARLSSSDGKLFVLRAVIVVRQPLEYGQTQANINQDEVWWLYYQQESKRMSIGVRFLHGWQVHQVLINNSQLTDFENLRGPLGKLRGIGARALIKLS